MFSKITIGQLCGFLYLLILLTMRKTADGESYRVPPTIDDPAVLPEIEVAAANHRLGEDVAHSPVWLAHIAA